ncbi:MAG: secondary thiamine-phosphate synthase enzyme YjbQ [Bdellovibrionales bacterium]|nr:secondary thiamine-phosphate synthase enzyme YjbQ [Bdellovibrionales bacterium]
MHSYLKISTQGQGLYEITEDIERAISSHGYQSGLVNIFLQHTSASLVIQENADPSAKRDLESWLGRFIREDDSHFTHTAEGSDDMPAHIKAAITATSLCIPLVAGQLALGTWQGIYLWEHRRAAHLRKIIVTVLDTNIG